MKKTTILILLLLAGASSGQKYNQKYNRDSLWAVWNNKSLHDTARLSAIDDLARSYKQKKPDSAMILAKIQLELASRGNYKKEMAWAYQTQGYVFYEKEKYVEAIHAWTKSLELAKEIGRKTVISYDYCVLGNIYYGNGNYPRALECYRAALKIEEERKNKDGQADMINNIGLIYGRIKNTSLALEYYFRALSLRDTNNKDGLRNNYLNIGGSYSSMGDYVKALNFYAKFKKLSEEMGDMRGIAGYYNNLGILFREKGDPVNAMINYRESMKICEKIQHKEGMARASLNIGGIYKDQKNFTEAILWSERSLKLSGEIGLLKLQRDACNNLYEAYKGLGNSAKALAYHEESIKLDDSLKTEETAKKLQQMEFQKQMLTDSLKQEEEKLKVEMAHKEQMHRQRVQKILLFSAIAVVLVCSFGIWRRLRYTRKAKVEIEKAKGVIEKEKERSENLLLNILPSEVAEEIKQDGHSKARTFSMVTVMFTDFKDFTAVSEKYSAELLVAEIDYCFSSFDNIIQKYSIEKIKTVGDAYMCAGGMPVLTTTHAEDVVNAAIEIRNFMLERKKEQDAKGGISFELRLGVHTGPVVAGIVGVKKYAYDIWGDTVNIAARMEQNSEAGKINISGSTHKLVKDKFNCVYRGKIEAKNKGEVEMYFVETLS